ncbi:MAG: NAD(+)/NADH kinase [Candidatus Pacebacteria bacterium]|nr:NAD(+)/NADH kinase [Candidatus Paceibacterota bacterium]
MKTLGLCANTGKPRAPEVLRRIVSKPGELGMRVIVDAQTSILNPELETVGEKGFAGEVDAVIALGGDGTLLRAIHSLREAGIPVMGVNIGGLGFLTSVSEGEIDQAMECLADDHIEVSTNPIMVADVQRDGVSIDSYHALNEVVVARGPASRMVQLDLHVSGKAVTTYSCDGILVATPVGSTGYSLSSGGPILVPGTPALVITPICPHTLGSRPMVVPESSEIEISTRSAGQELLLATDGQTAQPLRAGDTVRISRSAHSAQLLHLPGHSFYALLRQKLHWRGSSIK